MKVFIIHSAIACLLFLSSFSSHAKDLNKADIIGKVGDITIAYKGAHSEHTVVRIYFASIEKDRWGCISSTGYVEATDASPYVTTERLNKIYTMVLTAHTTGKSFGTGGPPDCKAQNFGVLFNDL